MAALFGREDQLLEPSRFARFLRQANDAEMADVRTLGDGSLEVSPHRTDLGFARNAAPAPLGEAAGFPSGNGTPAQAGTGTEPAARTAAALRFRRGSRSPMRPQDVPLIGLVRFEEDAPPVVTPPTAAEAPPPRAAARRGARGRGAKSAASPRAAADAPAGGEPDAAPAAKKRTRSRPRKSG
jgi:hypothetical protein